MTSIAKDPGSGAATQASDRPLKEENAALWCVPCVRILAVNHRHRCLSPLRPASPCRTCVIGHRDCQDLTPEAVEHLARAFQDGLGSISFKRCLILLPAELELTEEEKEEAAWDMLPPEYKKSDADYQEWREKLAEEKKE